MTSDNSRHRLGLIAVMAVSLFGALFARLWILQVVEGQALDTEAQQQSTRTVITPAPRGQIFDRNGEVLVRNRPSVVLGVDLQKYAALDEDVQKVLLADLAAALAVGRPAAEQLTPKAILQTLNNARYSRYRPIPIAEDLGPEDEIFFREQIDRFPAVVVERTTVRDYPHGSLAAHVLGYVGALSDTAWKRLEEEGNEGPKPYVRSDEIGLSGVESSYEANLRGTPGKRVYEVDRTNRVVRELVDQRIDPRPGDDVYLSIDARVQAETEISLRSGIEAARATSSPRGGFLPAETGAAAVVDPANGQVVAMASYPTYNPADLVGGISQKLWDELNDEANGLPLNNRAIAGAYPPGSTFKLASAHAGLKLGIITPETQINDPGVYTVPGCDGGDSCEFSSPSAEYGGGGAPSLGEALTVSSDVYFYSLGNDAWALYKDKGTASPTAFQDAVDELGYSKKTGIDLPGEQAGRIPDPEWLKAFSDRINGEGDDRGVWRAGASINMAIGQGDVLVTPLQLANSYAAFANGGTLYQPSVLDRIVPSGATEPTTTYDDVKEELGRIDWGGAAHQVMLEGFEGVTSAQGGTARAAFEGFDQSGWPVAGKTGTAQTGPDNDRLDDNSLFVGFGPGNAPRYAAAVVMEHAGSGGSAAAPAVRRIFEAIATNQLDAVDLDAVSDPASFATDAYGSAQVGSGLGAASGEQEACTDTAEATCTDDGTGTTGTAGTGTGTGTGTTGGTGIDGLTGTTWTTATRDDAVGTTTEEPAD